MIMAPQNCFTTLVLLVAGLTGFSMEEPYLVGLAPGFTPRDEIVQGWALVENLCPDGTGGCGKRSCCPIGSYCDDNEATNSNLCCPTRAPCGSDVSKASRCAVSSWVEWFTSKDPICCLPGEIGVQPGPNDYYGYCSSAGSNIASSLLASTVLSPSTASATSESSSPSTAPTASAGSSTSAIVSLSSSIASSSSVAVVSVTSTSPSASVAMVPTTSASSANSASATPTKAATSSAAASVNTSVNRSLNAFLGILGVIVGFLAI